MGMQAGVLEEKRTQRSYGLDLLRILSMLMIVVLHSSSHGGTASVPAQGADGLSFVFWTLQAMSIVSVNVFALISAWFLCVQQFRLSRVVRVILPVLFYSWLITGCLLLSGRPLEFSEMISSIFPLSFRRYWFMTAYVGMVLLSPVLNRIIEGLSRRQHLAVLLVALLMSVVWSDLIPLSDPFTFASGYGVAWFVVLYFLAAYLRRYICMEKIRYAGWIYGGCIALLMLSLAVLYFLSGKIPVLQQYGMHQYYFRYNSVFVVAASLALLVAFAKLTICAEWLKRLIGRIAPLTMGVYLIHDNPGIREILWREWLPIYQWERNGLLPLKVLGAVLLIFTSCILLEYARQLLFRLVERRKWYAAWMHKIDSLAILLYNRLPD